MAPPHPSVPGKFLSFLPHHVLPPGGSPAIVDEASMNPGFLTSTGVNRDATLQAIVERRVLSDPDLKKLRFALVDLTGSTNFASPKFAGNRETEQGGLGSMAKLACMYTAYQLQHDLKVLSLTKSGLTTAKPLFDAARDIWNDTQKPDKTKKQVLFPSDPKIELLGKLIEIDGSRVPIPRPFSSPDLEEMFTVSAGVFGADVNFKGSDLILVDPSAHSGAPDISPDAKTYADTFEHGNLEAVRKLTFAERMFLMIDDSDNPGAHTCIENVSFLYMVSALWQSSIYSPQRGGGMWEGTSHDGAVQWHKPPVPRHNPRADFVSGTAASCATLLTLLEQNRLVSKNACAGMKQLTSKKKALGGRGSLTRSYFLEGLRSVHVPLDRIHSKLGIGDFRNDGAIVVRTVTDPADSTKTKQIRYVATGFDEPDPGTKSLHKLIIEFDNCIQENNGLLSASSPGLVPP
jgi:hypothetical protein